MNRRLAYRVLLTLGALGVALSWWNWNRFAPTLVAVPGLETEPSQRQVDLAPFRRNVNAVDYQIRPLYEYQLTGLVVSFKRFRPGIGIHDRWGDYINVADICVVWGDNAELDLNAFDFWNLEFTCVYSTRDQQAWQAFDKTALSNNHLVTDNPEIQARLAELQVGDQIRLAGWLAEYGKTGGPMRGTSTTRTDTGNGACETIYLTDFEILRPMPSAWRQLWNPSWALLLVGIGLWWTTPHRHSY